MHVGTPPPVFVDAREIMEKQRMLPGGIAILPIEEEWTAIILIEMALPPRWHRVSQRLTRDID